MFLALSAFGLLERDGRYVPQPALPNHLTARKIGTRGHQGTPSAAIAWRKVSSHWARL